jgi:isopenicillin N synthase-like dioxygenase
MAAPELDPITERICKLVRMFGAEENVANVAFAKLRNFFAQETLSFNDLATVIEKAAKGYYSGEEVIAAAAKAKEFGEQSGYAKAKREASGPPEFYDSDGEPRWYEIARFIDERKSRLNGWERGFVEGDANRGSLVVNMAKFGSPTPKQTKHVLGIFIKLGGTVPPEVVQRYR